MPRNVLIDASGLYLVPGIVSIHPLEKRGDPRDQTKITEVHTAISTAGGQTHHTNIPFELAKEIILEHWQPKIATQQQQRPPQKPEDPLEG